MFHRRFAIGAIALAGVLAACTVFQVPEDAKAVGTRYFEAVREHRVEDALSLYSPLFFETTPKERWSKTLEKVSEKLGDLKSYELSSWSVKRMVSTSHPGTYSVMTFKVEYAKYAASERLTVYQPVSGGEPRITAHTISSEGLILE